MNFETLGHFIIHGATGSGKSFYARHLVHVLPHEKVYVFTQSPHEWAKAIDKNGKIELAYTVYTEDFEANARKILEDCGAIIDRERKEATTKGKEYKTAGRFNIVFDDFNESINTKTDETYKSLFTRSRHVGCRVINLVHQAHSIGPTARMNARYLVFMSTAPDSEIIELAKLFYAGNHPQLLKIAAEARAKNKHMAVVVDIKSRIVAFDLAQPLPAEYVNIVMNEDGSFDLPEEDGGETTTIMPATRQVDAMVGISPNSVLGSGGTPVYGGLQPAVAQNFAIGGTRNAQNMVDNSKTNVQINSKIRAEQLIETNQAQVKIKIDNITNNYIIELRQGINDVRDLICKPYKTPDEKIKITHIMNKALRCQPPLTIMDYEEAIPVFMKTYFPEHGYTGRKTKEGVIVESIGNIANGYQSPMYVLTDVVNLVGTVAQKPIIGGDSRDLISTLLSTKLIG